jgi:hypothetical protein
MPEQAKLKERADALCKTPMRHRAFILNLEPESSVLVVTDDAARIG